MNEELLAEVERLKERAARADRVKLVVKRWEKLNASRERLQAEVEQLRAELAALEGY